MTILTSLVANKLRISNLVNSQELLVNKQIDELKDDLDWALNLLNTHPDLSVLDDETIIDLRVKWFSGNPWRPAKKRHKSPALKQARKDIEKLKSFKPKQSFALFLADFKAARDQ